jgi:hypothetical protein
MPGMFFDNRTANRITRQLATIDRKLDLLLTHLGIERL